MSQIIISTLIDEDEEMRELLLTFVESLPSLITDVISAFNQKNWDGTRESAHKLKGLGGSYGYPMLTDLAASIETQIKQTQLDGIEEKMIALQTMCDQIIAGLK